MPILPNKHPSSPAKQTGSIWQKDVYEIITFGRKGKISNEHLGLLFRNTSYLLGAGLPIKSVLPVLQGQNLGSSLNAILPQIHTHVMKGISFSDALKLEKIFPQFAIAYISIGEKTAQLAIVCEKLADYYEQQDQTRKEIFATLAYPASVLVMMLGVIILAMVTLLPGYADIFASADIVLPRATELLLDTSAFINRNWVWIILSFATTLVLCIAFLKSKIGSLIFTKIMLKLPIISLWTNLHITQALDILLMSGIKVSDAIPLCAELIDNDYVKQDLVFISQQMTQGATFAGALQEIKYIQPIFCDLATVGEKTGDLPSTMKKCNSYFALQYKNSLSKINKLIEPVITLVMGIMLALLMLAVVLPTFQLATSL